MSQENRPRVPPVFHYHPEWTVRWCINRRYWNRVASAGGAVNEEGEALSLVHESFWFEVSATTWSSQLYPGGCA